MNAPQCYIIHTLPFLLNMIQFMIPSQNYHLNVFGNIHVWVCFQIQLSVLVVCNLLLIRGIQIGEKSKPDRLMMFSKCTMCADSIFPLSAVGPYLNDLG